MTKKRRPFRMKQFEACDSMSANKIGVDGVMIGSWAPVPAHCRRILDVGCGCGIISLMLAQRAGEALVTGVDIEPGAVEEASRNALASVFSDRIAIREVDFGQIVSEVTSGALPRFDIIVSNPPFFESGGNPEESERMLARHAGSLSPEVLLRHASECLAPGGVVAFIAPYIYYERYLAKAREHGLSPLRACIVKGNPSAEPKRVMLAFTPSDSYDSSDKRSVEHVAERREFHEEHLTIQTAPGDYTPEYIELGRPFYLKF